MAASRVYCGLVYEVLREECLYPLGSFTEGVCWLWCLFPWIWVVREWVTVAICRDNLGDTKCHVQPRHMGVIRLIPGHANSL